MRVTVVGYGSMGRRHAANCRALGHEVAVVEPESLASRHAWRDGYVVNPLDWRPDAMVIATPASTHAAIAEHLLSEGYCGPLFVEKPLALSLAECDVFRRWPHPTTMVGYNLRFHFLVAEAHRRFSRHSTDGWFVLHCDARTWPGANYGPLLAECSHEIDMAIHFGAPPIVTSALLTEHSASLLLCDRWRVLLNDRAEVYHRLWAVNQNLAAFRAAFSRPADLGEQMYHDEIVAFLGAAKHSMATPCPFSSGMDVLSVMDQAHNIARRAA